MSSVRVVGIAAGLERGGRTRAAISCVLDGAAKAGASTLLLELAEVELSEAIRAIEAADAIVFGSPVYRATYSALLKEMLERTERGKWGEKTAPLHGKAAAIVLTGASAHHFLALGDLRNTLAGFFAVQVLSPGLYLDHGGFVDRTTPTEESASVAAAHGAALVDLAVAVRSSPALSALTPQV